jgi:transposase
VVLSEADRQQLQQWRHAHGTPQQVALRCGLVLGGADGQSDLALAQQWSVNRHTCRLWRERFLAEGSKSLWEIAPGRGRKPAGARHQRILETTVGSKPQGQTHWSTRTLAKVLGTSDSMVRRVWRANGLKPHLSRTFKLSNDPRFVEKLIDVVGLYLNPPEHALVLSCDEKSQIQALDRTQPGLPIKPGRCGTMTHDYKRNGTTTLFAALEMAEGKVIGTCMSRHRHQEWIKFLRLVDSQTPSDLDLHLIADNYFTHKTPQVQRWLKRHPRFHMHFIPTSSSWLNLVERWFREITDQRIRRESFANVGKLIAVIMDYLAKHNEHPKALVWTAKVDEILAKVRRARAVLNNVQSI